MFPIKKVLCPTDFSEPSYAGLEIAKEIASHFSVELILVHVVSSTYMYPGAGFNMPVYLEDMINASRKSMDEIASEKIPPSMNVRKVILDGGPADQIVDLAEREKVDMIVIATHGLTGWRRFIFGSVAEKVVRLATCPVLTVPGPEEE